MTIAEKLEKLQMENNPKTASYQEASSRFESLIEKGLASRRTPIEIGRSDLVCNIYSYNNSKGTNK